tara:strand:+ start:362 stop:643 length:282 start_codon:yes stop_codon:yes gene_type:complete
METANVEVNVDNFKKILNTPNSFQTKNDHDILVPFIAVVIEHLDELGEITDLVTSKGKKVMTGFDKYFDYTVTQYTKTKQTEILRRPKGLAQS